MQSDQEKKDRLDGLIGESGQKGEEIVKKSSELTQFGQDVSDLANASRNVLKYVPAAGIDWELKISSWEYVSQQEDAILGKIASISPVLASSSTASYSMVDFASATKVVPFVTPERRPEAAVAVQRLSSVIDKQAEKTRVTSLLRQFGLVTVAPGQKSPVELFDAAWAAFEKPVTQNSPASTSLIPMRESINATIAELLRRRPKQEPAKGARNKLLSITGQLVRDNMPQAARELLAEHYDQLVNDLSASKQKIYTRQEWGDDLRRATLFLRELLEAIDQSKLSGPS